MYVIMQHFEDWLSVISSFQGVLFLTFLFLLLSGLLSVQILAIWIFLQLSLVVYSSW